MYIQTILIIVIKYGAVLIEEDTRTEEEILKQFGQAQDVHH